MILPWWHAKPKQDQNVWTKIDLTPFAFSVFPSFAFTVNNFGQVWNSCLIGCQEVNSEHLSLMILEIISLPIFLSNNKIQLSTNAGIKIINNTTRVPPTGDHVDRSALPVAWIASLLCKMSHDCLFSTKMSFICNYTFSIYLLTSLGIL